MQDRAKQTDTNHDINPVRVVIAAAPFVALIALTLGVNIEAQAEYERTVEVLRATSWAAATLAFVWICVIAMMGGGPRTKVGLELRMFVERNSRMPYVANAYSAVSAAVTLTTGFAMVG